MAVGLAAALVVGVNLGGYALWDPDESKHAEIARELYVGGGGLQPTINFEPYYHKPPLFYLLVGGAYRLFGVTEGAARAVPALACWLAVMVVFAYVAGAPRAGPRDGAVAAALLLASVFYVYVGRFVNLDSLVACTTAASLLYFARWSERGGTILPAYALLGFATLVKGPMALALVGPPVALAVATKNVRLSSLRLPSGLAVLAVVLGALVVPWAIEHPQYLRSFLIEHNIGRYLPGDVLDYKYHPQPVWYFVPVLAAAMLPWSPLVPTATAAALRRGGADRTVAVYAIWVVVFFSVSTGKLATYVLPAIPAFAVVVARWLCREHREPAPAVLHRATDVAAVLMAVLPFGAGIAAANDFPMSAWHGASFAPAGVAAAYCVATAGGRARALLDRQMVLCAGMAASLVAFSLWTAPAVSRALSDADLAKVARSLGTPQTAAAFGVRPHSFQFYSGWPLLHKATPDEYRRALEGDGLVVFLTRDRWDHHTAAMSEGLDLIEVARNHRHKLLVNRVP